MSKLLVDGAVGSNELIAPLQKLGLPAVKAHLEYGDLCWMGRGEGGKPLFIGVELKRISDMVSSLRTKRFQGHQLLGLTRDFDRRYLLIEGDYHHDDSGKTVVFRGPGRPSPLAGAPNAVVLEQELLNIQTRGGVWIRHVTTRKDTLRWILACYRYWTDKDLDMHRSHMAVYAPDLDKGLLTPPSDFRKALVVLVPGIGLAASKRVEEECWDARLGAGSFRKLMLKTEDWWAALTLTSKSGKTKRLGAKRAAAIMEALG